MTTAPDASSTVHAALQTLDEGLAATVERTFDLLAIPSISTDPAYNAQCAACAAWCAEQLSELGFEASVRPTDGQPMVVGHYKRQGADERADGAGDGAKRAHVLFYGHYDVQPADPLELWTRGPFEPTLQDQAGAVIEVANTPRGEAADALKIVARGASDDKGQVMTFIEACRAWLATGSELPIDVTILLEGEEECGSPSVEPFLRENADELRADLVLVCDTGQPGPRQPAVTTMLRGLADVEMTVTGPSRDLHSGMYGGPALNPIRELSRLLALLHDSDGQVLLPGFYDAVRDIDPDQRAQWETIGDAAAFLGDVGLTQSAGEAGRSVHELIWARPTAEVNGIFGGYTGVGTKTVIPSTATAKLSFRLVADQDPQAIVSSFKAFMEANCHPDAKLSFHSRGGAPAISFDTGSAAMQAAAAGLREEWETEPVFMGCGGSIPIVHDFKHKLGMDTLLIGFAQDDDAIHSPNEKYNVLSLRKGARSWIRIMDQLAQLHG